MDVEFAAYRGSRKVNDGSDLKDAEQLELSQGELETRQLKAFDKSANGQKRSLL
jgi:hypothetical protein